MSKEAMKLALENSQPSFMSPGWTLVRNEDITALREALAEQPAQTDWEAVAADQAMTIALMKAEQSAQQQEPVAIADGTFNHNCPIGTPLYTSPPAQRKPLTDEWVPVTQSLLNEQHPWFYQPMWIAMKDGAVLQGHYEWRQGWNPDRFIADGFDHWVFDANYVMPVIKPTPPAIEAAHGIKEQP